MDVAAPALDRMDEQVPVTYRVVQNEEVLLLKPLFDRLGWPLPDPDMAKIVVAEAGEGEKTNKVILGFAVVQFITHCEPLWVYPGARGTGLAEKLANAAFDYVEHDCGIKRYVVTAKQGSFAARIAEKRGFRMRDGNVWERVVGQGTIQGKEPGRA